MCICARVCHKLNDPLALLILNRTTSRYTPDSTVIYSSTDTLPHVLSMSTSLTPWAFNFLLSLSNRFKANCAQAPQTWIHLYIAQTQKEQQDCLWLVTLPKTQVFDTSIQPLHTIFSASGSPSPMTCTQFPRRKCHQKGVCFEKKSSGTQWTKAKHSELPSDWPTSLHASHVRVSFGWGGGGICPPPTLPFRCAENSILHVNTLKLLWKL